MRRSRCCDIAADLWPPLLSFCFCLSRSGCRQAWDMSGSSSYLQSWWGAAVSQTGNTGRGAGPGHGRRPGVPPVDGSGPHRPVLSSPGPADWGAACGDRKGATVASRQPDHRQRSVVSCWDAGFWSQVYIKMISSKSGCQVISRVKHIPIAPMIQSPQVLWFHNKPSSPPRSSTMFARLMPACSVSTWICIMTKHLYFNLIFPNNIVLEVLCFYTIFICKRISAGDSFRTVMLTGYNRKVASCPAASYTSMPLFIFRLKKCLHI